MLEVKQVSYNVGNKRILRNISFSAERGKICAVIGPNGAGKSTLLRLIAGHIKPAFGGITADGDDISVMGGGMRAKRVSYLPQSTEAVACTVHDAVLLGRKPLMGWYPSEEDFERTADVLEYAGLTEQWDKCVTKLSGGEFQKVMIARAMAQESPILLLDEPVNHLDIKNRIDVMEMMAEITLRNNLASVIVMHDINLALRYADTLLILDRGEQIDFCSVIDVDGGLLSTVYQIPVDIMKHNGRLAAVY